MGEPAKKAGKKKIVIEEVDSSKEAAPEPAKKAGKKKIAIEEVDSSKEAAPEPAKKAGKKKIVIEEVDSSKEAAPVEEPAKKAGKKKIVIEEVDSSNSNETLEAPTPLRVRPCEPTDTSAPSPVKTVTSPASPKAPKLPGCLRSKLMAPRTGYEFERKLETLKDPQSVCDYLDLLKPAQIPKLLSQDLSVEILMTVCNALSTASMKEGASAAVQVLRGFAKVNRFDIILDFLSKDEKDCIEGAFANLEGAEGLEDVRRLYLL